MRHTLFGDLVHYVRMLTCGTFTIITNELNIRLSFGASQSLQARSCFLAGRRLRMFFEALLMVFPSRRHVWGNEYSRSGL